MKLAGRVSILLGLVATTAAFAPCRPVRPLWASGRSARPNTVARLGATTVSRPETTTPFQTSTAYNPSPDGSQVDWWKQWWPMYFVDDLEYDRPVQIQLLGKRFVVWADKERQWHCFEDLCPHRLAPLSEGRIDEGGNLQCAYHGWSFDSQGKCVNIPQAESEIKGVAEAATRACAKAIPTKVAQGMLWVWPDNSKEGLELSKVKQPATLPELDDPAYVMGAWVARDLEYGYDTLIENVVDPAHVPFAHHNVQAKRSHAVPLNVSVQSSSPDGVYLALPRFANSTIEFEAPTRLRYKFDFSNFFNKVPLMKLIFNIEKAIRGLPRDMKPHTLLVTYAIPRAPGRSRVLALFPRNFFTIQKPRWLDHLERNAVLDGDLVFLHGQEREMRKPEYKWAENIDRTFYMPTKSDEGVRAFRQWIAKFGGKGPRWADGVSGELPAYSESREFLMDRYTQHTKQCSACRGALRNTRIAKNIFTALAVLGASAIWSRPANLVRVLAGSAVSAIIAYALSRLERRFIFTDYVHATR